MRVDRKTFWLFLPLALAAAPVAYGDILGGGPAKADCYMSFEGLEATKGKFLVECRDNDPCDIDPTGGQCGFSFAVCVGTETSPGCTATTVTSFKGTRSLTVPPTPAAPGTCAEPTNYTLKLKRNGRPNKRAFKPSALTADGKPKRDLDTLILRCIASPSGAFVFE